MYLFVMYVCITCFFSGRLEGGRCCEWGCFVDEQSAGHGSEPWSIEVLLWVVSGDLGSRSRLEFGHPKCKTADPGLHYGLVLTLLSSSPSKKSSVFMRWLLDFSLWWELDWNYFILNLNNCSSKFELQKGVAWTSKKEWRYGFSGGVEM